MIKTTEHSLKYITAKKKQLLDRLFVEYTRVVNEYIKLSWGSTKVCAVASAKQWKTVNSWLCGKTMKGAYRKASQIIRAAYAQDKKKRYTIYKRVFFYAKKKKKNWDIVKKTWSEWSKDKDFRLRVKMPVFSGARIVLHGGNGGCLRVYTEMRSMRAFDLAVRINSIFGNRVTLFLPTKKHKHFNKLITNGYSICSSIALHKASTGYYLSLFLEKEPVTVKDTGKVLAIDVGIKKLISTSEGVFLGKDFENKIKKLNRRIRNSNNFKKTIIEIKDYIGQQVRKLNLDDVAVIVVEDINIKNMQRKNKSSKTIRRLLSNWNVRLLFRRLAALCEENRVLFTSIEPRYTSQRCSFCGDIHKKSRNKEKYSCVACGKVLDADYNAARNILSCFLDRDIVIPYEQNKL